MSGLPKSSSTGGAGLPFILNNNANAASSNTAPLSESFSTDAAGAIGGDGAGHGAGMSSGMSQSTSASTTTTNNSGPFASSRPSGAGGAAHAAGGAIGTPYFLDRDPESSASAKRRSLVRAGGTASSPDLRSLVNKKAKDLAAAAAAAAAAASSGGPSANNNGGPTADSKESGPVPFPSARSGTLSPGLAAGQFRGPSRDDGRELRYGGYTNPNTGINNLAGSLTASTSMGANSVSLAEEVVLNSPNPDEKGGTVKSSSGGGAFKERMKKTSGFLRRLRGGGGAAASSTTEPLPVGLGVTSNPNATLKPIKPHPAIPSQFSCSAPLTATRSISHGASSFDASRTASFIPATSNPQSPAPSAHPSLAVAGAVSPPRSGTPKIERELPVPPRPPRRSSRGGASATHSTSPPTPYKEFAPTTIQANENRGNAAAGSGSGAISPPANDNLQHRPTHSIDPELDPDVAHFADRAWSEDEPLNLQPPTLSLLTSSAALGSSASGFHSGNDTIKASLGPYSGGSSTPSGTPISTRFVTRAMSSTGSVSGPGLGAGATGTGSNASGSVSVLPQRNDHERRSFSSNVVSPTESVRPWEQPLPGSSTAAAASAGPSFVISASGPSSSAIHASSSRKLSTDAGESGAKSSEGEPSTLAEKAWNEQDQFARKEKIAEWLGSDNALNRATCTAYFKNFDFSSLRVDVAFRKLCDKLFLRAETQQIDRVLSAFSQRYWECNQSSIYGSADVVHSIVFSLLLLNTDLHVADIQDRMTRQQFVRNTIAAIQESSGMDGPSGSGGNGGATSASGSIYGSIGAAASASGVVITPGVNQRPPHSSIGAESSTSLSRLSADVRNESSEFVSAGGNVGPMGIGSSSAAGATSSLSPTLAPARPSRRASVRSYQGIFRSGANSSLVNVSGERDDGASIASADRPTGFASPSSGGGGSTSRGQYPPSVGLNATSFRQRTRSGSGNASLAEVQSAINSRMWLVDLESQLKDIYNTVKNDQIRLPMYDSRATLSPTFARRGMRNLTVGGTGTSRVSALKRGSIRGIQGLLGSSATINSEGTTSPVSSMASRSFLDSSPHTPATSLSSSTVSQPTQALGFASTLSQSIIKESNDEDSASNGASANDDIDDDDLALMGPPWAKEGFLTRKHYYEGPHKRSKDKAWVEVFVVVQKGMLNMFQFNSSGSSTIKASSGSKGGESAVVGGGNWLSNATPLGEFPLAHTLANALPPPGYNRARPHVFALTLPGGTVYLFQAGHEELVQEWVATCNYWAARQSREPLAGGVSNMEYGWNKVLPRDYDEIMDDTASTSFSLTNGNATGSSYDPASLSVSNSPRAADTRSIRSGKSARSFRHRAGAALYQNWHDAASLVAPSHLDSHKDGAGLRSPAPSVLGAGQSPIHANERIFINEWKAPEAPMVASDLLEEKQLNRCTKHMQSIEADLTAHNELRQPMLQLYSPRGTNYSKALTNWERKSNHLLQELVKYQCYVESLKNAMRLRAEKHDLKEVDKMLASADEELSVLREEGSAARRASAV